MKELLEVRLDAVLVLAQRDLDVLGLYRVVQGCLLHLKLVQALNEGVAERTSLDCLHQVRDALLDVPALRLKTFEVSRRLVMLPVVHGGVHRKRHQVLRVVDGASQDVAHEVLNPVLLDLPLRAQLLPLGGAIVVVIRAPCLARARDALHRLPALAAVQLPGQPVARSAILVHSSRPLGTLALVLGEPLLNPVERRLVDQRGHTVRDDIAPVPVLADVRAVLEHPVHRLHAEQGTPRRTQPLRVELVAYVLHRPACGVLREHPLHERRGVRVDGVLLGLPVHLLHAVPEQLVPVVVRALGVVVHPALDVLRQIAAVILRHGVHQPLDEDALGTFRRDVLRQQVYLAARIANLLLRHRQHVLIATQTVGLPHDESVRTDFCDLGQHQLESRSVFLRARYGRVLILSDDFQPVRVRPFMGKLTLLVDARLVLRVGREAIVCDSEVVVIPFYLLPCQTNHLLFAHKRMYGYRPLAPQCGRYP